MDSTPERRGALGLRFRLVLCRAEAVGRSIHKTTMSSSRSATPPTITTTFILLPPVLAFFLRDRCRCARPA